MFKFAEDFVSIYKYRSRRRVFLSSVFDKRDIMLVEPEPNPSISIMSSLNIEVTDTTLKYRITVYGYIMYIVSDEDFADNIIFDQNGPDAEDEGVFVLVSELIKSNFLTKMYACDYISALYPRNSDEELRHIVVNTAEQVIDILCKSDYTLNVNLV